VTGDVREDPSLRFTDNAVVEPCVSIEVPNHHHVDLYTTRDDTETTTQPFVHEVELKGEKESKAKVKGLFDDGAMVNGICNKVFTTLRSVLGALTPSQKTLRMADGTLVPSDGQWIGDVILGGHMVKGVFEVFPSGGGWSLLFGKPLLK